MHFPKNSVVTATFAIKCIIFMNELIFIIFFASIKDQSMKVFIILTYLELNKLCICMLNLGISLIFPGGKEREWKMLCIQKFNKLQYYANHVWIVAEFQLKPVLFLFSLPFFGPLLQFNVINALSGLQLYLNGEENKNAYCAACLLLIKVSLFPFLNFTILFYTLMHNIFIFFLVIKIFIFFLLEF